MDTAAVWKLLDEHGHKRLCPWALRSVEEFSYTLKVGVYPNPEWVLDTLRESFEYGTDYRHKDGGRPLPASGWRGFKPEDVFMTGECCFRFVARVAKEFESDKADGHKFVKGRVDSESWVIPYSASDFNFVRACTQDLRDELRVLRAHVTALEGKQVLPGGM